jgi:hypothetical protein
MLLQASIRFSRGRGISSAELQGIESAHTTSMKSVWPFRAAEQPLRLRPLKIEDRQSMPARLRVAFREGKGLIARVSLQATGTVKAKPI